MCLSHQDDAATLAWFKHINPDHDRIWRAYNDLGARRTRGGAGAVRLLHAPDGVGAMTPHTPGIWTVSPPDDEGSTDIHAGAYCVATAHGWCGVNDDGTSKTPANATLIAAAPEMLAVLEAINHTLHAHGHVDASTPLHLRIEAAIAKAAP